MRSSAEAVADLRQSLSVAVSCVTRAHLRSTGHHPAARSHWIEFATQTQRVRLRGSQRFQLSVDHYYRVQPASPRSRGWETVTVGYAYALLRPDDTELLTFHWHPTGQSPIIFPHLHVGLRDPAITLGKAHVPTGRIPLAAVVWFAIAELGVEPLRPDWREVLTPVLGQLVE